MMKLMNKMKLNQFLMLLLLGGLLFITPLLPTSIRYTYLYFIMNLLIIELGAEAGLLKAFSKPLDHHNPQDHKIKTSTTTHHAPPPPLASSQASHDNKITNEDENKNNKVVKVVEKSKSEKMVAAVKMEIKVRKCPSMPSLFFIGGGDEHDQTHHEEDLVDMGKEEEEEVVGGDLSGQELFTKAEMFIGNFYKQLKMQREDSWKRIHGFYQRAF